MREEIFKMVRRMVFTRSDVHMLLFSILTYRNNYTVDLSVNLDWGITNMPIPFKK